MYTCFVLEGAQLQTIWVTVSAFKPQADVCLLIDVGDLKFFLPDFL